MNKEIFNTTRRQFLMNSGFGLGAAALGMMSQMKLKRLQLEFYQTAP